ncbi:MAG: AEC family transporter [Elusimicrobiota bacterium]|jgi:hypothetical protein
MSIALNTSIPILALIAAGWLARRMGWLRSGDERVLNSYVYYFALPAMFFVDLAEMRFTPDNLRFILAGILPVILALALFLLLYAVLRFSRETLYLMIESTAFGSLAFFGIPFLHFAFPGQVEHLATLATASISIIGVAASLMVLEIRQAGGGLSGPALRIVAWKLARNPLIISILAGGLFSLSGIALPEALSQPLHMLGRTTVTVAIFLLGVFLYGRAYTGLGQAFRLSLLRMALLPLLALGVDRALGVTGMDHTVLVIMQAVPVALSMIVLSERYDFHKETIASLVLVSSLGSAVYLNLWLWLLH